MEKVEYNIIQLKGSAQRHKELLDYLNEVEDWELVTVMRGRPTTKYPHGAIFAYLKRPLNTGDD